MSRFDEKRRARAAKVEANRLPDSVIEARLREEWEAWEAAVWAREARREAGFVPVALLDDDELR